ncbi:MAG TPA: hypothetical protein VF981_05230 [Gemmatimonadaceae bacterium]
MAEPSHDVLDGGSLPALLAARARQASDRRLAIDAGLGVAVLVAVLIFRPPLWWSFAGLAACFGSFGIWGILDRELRQPLAGREPARRVLAIARATVATFGAFCGVMGALTLFFAMLGPWKS